MTHDPDSSAPTASPRAQLAPRGVLRVGTNFGNPVVAQRDCAGGEPRGVGPALGRELARRFGLEIAYVTYDTAGKMADAVRSDAWDVAFLAADPARAEDIAFSAPYLRIEGTYLVPEGSPFARTDDLDRPGVRISVADKSAYGLHLARHIRHAELVRLPTSGEAIAAFLDGRVDAAAGVRQPLMAAARSAPGVRVIEGAFMTIDQACGVPRARAAAAACVQRFIEEMKSSGFVARALEDSGVRDATVLAGT